jgi:radical SAM protein (TIGR01212 family)
VENGGVKVIDFNQNREFIWGHERRFNAYAEYFKRKFGARVQKVAIDAGFTCPNRDGTVGTGGCTYCNNSAFNPSYCSPQKSVNQQIKEGIEFHQNRYRRAKHYLAYFQAFSNTHAPLETLKSIYEPSLQHPEIIGWVIGTRPDCIDEQKLEYFAKMAKKIYIIIEYGIESCENQTLKLVNRGHNFETAVKALELTKKYGLSTGAHFIFGLPYETPQQWLNWAKIISALPLTTIKLHQLQILKNTALCALYQQQKESFYRFELPDYVDFIVDFLEQLSPHIIIERLAGEVPPPYLAAPTWGLIRNDNILKLIENKLEQKDTWQGRLFFN